MGHETDFTLTDFAADVRAPTPSAAAELATPDRSELMSAVRELRSRLAEALRTRIRERHWALAERAAALRGLSPRAQLANSRQRLDDLTMRAQKAVAHALALRQQRADGLTRRLEALSPLAVLQRGYAIVARAETGEVIRSTAQVSEAEALTVRVSDGAFGVEVGDLKGTKAQRRKGGESDSSTAE